MQDKLETKARRIAGMEPRQALVLVLCIAVSVLAGVIATLWWLDRQDTKARHAAEVACTAAIAVKERECSDRVERIQQECNEKFNGFVLLRLSRYEQIEDKVDSALKPKSRR